MTKQLYSTEPDSINPDADVTLIPESEHCRRDGNVTRVTAWRRRRDTPKDWPRIIKINGRNYVVDAESRAIIKRRIEASK
jgi:hypothetical protein